MSTNPSEIKVPWPKSSRSKEHKVSHELRDRIVTNRGGKNKIKRSGMTVFAVNPYSVGLLITIVFPSTLDTFSMDDLHNQRSM